MINKRIISVVCIFSSIIAVAFCLLAYKKKENHYNDNLITTIDTWIDDKTITVSWDAYCEKQNWIELIIYSSEGYYEKIKLDGTIRSYNFREGQHGELYCFELSIMNSDLVPIEQKKCESMFIDYSKIPDIPLISIVTRNGEDPSATKAVPPEGYWGQSVTNNEYIEGYMVLSSSDKTYSVSSELEIKVRGNTSAAGVKKPYKLKLKNSHDLLGSRNASDKSNEWILLNCGTSLNVAVGNIVSSRCRECWQPDFQYVNLILNGDWKGCYVLIEDVEKCVNELSISKEGFIIENDPYWWNGEKKYFRSTYQFEPFRYTMKYPNYTNMEEGKKENIKQYIDDVESMIFEGDSNLENVMDLRSFATWIIMHDLLGTSDYAGSNMYMYNSDYSAEKSDINKLKMGPLWDFDSIMSTTDSWSIIHHSEVFYYIKLFENKEFQNVYLEEWAHIKDKVIEEASVWIDNSLFENKSALQDSWDLDASRWKCEYLPVEVQQQKIYEWLHNRTDWIEQNLEDI